MLLTTDRLRPYSRFDRVDVTVERAGGQDAKGNRLPVVRHVVEQCLVSVRSTEEDARTDLPDTDAYLFASPGADLAAQDVVVVPPDPRRLRPQGRFLVNGEPDFGQLGCRAQLKRV